MNIFYSFTLTLLHSIWQAALLVLFYYCITYFTPYTHPLKKRNLLYSFLLLQFVISIFTILLYLTNTQLFYTIFDFNTINGFAKYNYIFLFFYFGYVIIRSVTIFYQWYLFKRKYKTSLIKPSAAIKVFTTCKALQLGIKQKVAVWYSKKIDVPVTFGFLKPIILLPFSLINNISPYEIETIILHELTHIKYKDYLFNWVLVFVDTVYCFNPFVKILVKKLKLEREKNCDVQVLQFNYQMPVYAQVLLKIAKHNNQPKSFQMAAIATSQQLLQRILFFSNRENLGFKKYYSSLFIYLFLPIIIFITSIFLSTQKEIALKKTYKIAINTNKKIEVAYANYKLNTYNTKAINEEPKNIKISNKPKGIYNIKKNKPAATFLPIETTLNENIYKLASLNEIQDSTKELLYNLETTNGKLTQSYKLIKHNGAWKLYPQWMIVERNVDSTSKNKMDTTFNEAY